MFAIGAAWAAGCAVFTFVLALNNRIIIIETNLPFLEKQIDLCVKNDIYQIDKLLIQEKFIRR